MGLERLLDRSVAILLVHVGRVRPVALVVVPFDLRHIRVILYDVADPFWGQKLIDKIADNIKSALNNPEEAIFRAGFEVRPADRDEHTLVADDLLLPRDLTTEFEVAGILESALRQAGSDGFPFPSIVASGPNAALPHARPTARKLARGDFLLLDFGAEFSGYCADVTRTFVVGHADADQREVYDIVRVANERAEFGGTKSPGEQSDEQEFPHLTLE